MRVGGCWPGGRVEFTAHFQSVEAGRRGRGELEFVEAGAGQQKVWIVQPIVVVKEDGDVYFGETGGQRDGENNGPMVEGGSVSRNSSSLGY